MKKTYNILIYCISYGGSTIELFLPDSFMREQGYVQQHNEPIMSGYGDNYPISDIDSWPVIREIHPRDKRDSGERISYRAMETIHGGGKQPESAEKESITYQNGRYTLTYKNVNEKLTL